MRIPFVWQHKNVCKTGVLVLLVSMLFWVGCTEEGDLPTAPDNQQITLSAENPIVQRVMALQDEHTGMLMSLPNVVGTGTGMTEDGEAAIIVFTREAVNSDLQKGSALPAELDGVPVIEYITGDIVALKGGPPGPGFDPTDKHRPAPNGASLGHFNITAGTLGCVVEKGGDTYILSNNHVMADENNASTGDNILQPGPFDGGANPGDLIATLSEYEPIVFTTSANNLIDAAIALVDPADVTAETESGGYGAPSSTTVSATVGMHVRKYGRTTGETVTSKKNEGVSAINATVNVGYDSGTARFIDQIVISKRNFSAGGDSGSLIVDLNNNPVGLLFAGGSTTTIANPIDVVFDNFNVTIVVP